MSGEIKGSGVNKSFQEHIEGFTASFIGKRLTIADGRSGIVRSLSICVTHGDNIAVYIDFDEGWSTVEDPSCVVIEVACEP